MNNKEKLWRWQEDDNLDWDSIHYYMSLPPEELDALIAEDEERELRRLMELDSNGSNK